MGLGGANALQNLKIAGQNSGKGRKLFAYVGIFAAQINKLFFNFAVGRKSVVFPIGEDIAKPPLFAYKLCV